MIWFLGSAETSRILGAIADDLKRELKSRGIRFADDHAQFTAHITYARLREGVCPGVRLPKLKPVSFPLEELVLMESHLEAHGSRYEEIFSMEL